MVKTKLFKPKSGTELSVSGKVITVIVAILVAGAIAVTIAVAVNGPTPATPSASNTEKLHSNQRPIETGTVRLKASDGQALSCTGPFEGAAVTLLMWVRLDAVPKGGAILAERTGQWTFRVTHTGFMELNVRGREAGTANVVRSRVAALAERMHRWVQVGFTLATDATATLSMDGHTVVSDPINATATGTRVIHGCEPTVPITVRGDVTVAEVALFDRALGAPEVRTAFAMDGPGHASRTGAIAVWTVPGTAHHPILPNAVGPNHCSALNTDETTFRRERVAAGIISRPRR